MKSRRRRESTLNEALVLCAKCLTSRADGRVECKRPRLSTYTLSDASRLRLAANEEIPWRVISRYLPVGNVERARARESV